jgi:ribosome-associated heat shock protein Hsp15
MPQIEGDLRIDKWLWAARFFKTRSAALAAIKGGKVHLGGERIKPSRAVRLGDRLEITVGQQSMTVIVDALNAQRRPAPEARLLYTETDESRARRARAAEERHLLSTAAQTAGRPDKRQRRHIRRFMGKD